MHAHIPTIDDDENCVGSSGFTEDGSSGADLSEQDAKIRDAAHTSAKKNLVFIVVLY